MCGRCSMRRSASSACPGTALRQRPAVCLARGGRAVEAVGEGDQGRRGAGAHCAWQAAAEWPAGAAASDAVAGHGQSAGAQPARADRALAGASSDLYNEERPHAALGNDTPAEHYALSPRRFDGVLREPDYGADHAVRRVRHNGEIRWQGNTIYISEALVGEPVGLIEDEGGDCTANYGPIVLGVIAHGGDRLRKPKRHPCGLVDNARALPTGPTGPTTTDLNETRNVLPMSPVRTVTHVPGCSTEPASRQCLTLKIHHTGWICGRT